MATGCDGLFLEVHPDPPHALSDAASQLPLDMLDGLLATVVALDRAYYGTLQDLDRRFPFGPPRMRRCTRLSIRGDVVFGRDVELAGDVELRGPARIPDGALLGGVRAG